MIVMTLTVDGRSTAQKTSCCYFSALKHTFTMTVIAITIRVIPFNCVQYQTTAAARGLVLHCFEDLTHGSRSGKELLLPQWGTWSHGNIQRYHVYGVSEHVIFTL